MCGKRRGFTIIELLIVLVIVGILAAIAIPKFANTKERAFVAAMKADLRNLVTAQESYLADYRTYAGDGDPKLQYTSSSGITVTIQDESGSGWGATANHTGTSKVCAVFYGSGAKVLPPATQEGEPACQ